MRNLKLNETKVAKDDSRESWWSQRRYPIVECRRRQASQKLSFWCRTNISLYPRLSRSNTFLEPWPSASMLFSGIVTVSDNYTLDSSAHKHINRFAGIRLEFYFDLFAFIFLSLLQLLRDHLPTHPQSHFHVNICWVAWALCSKEKSRRHSTKSCRWFNRTFFLFCVIDQEIFIVTKKFVRSQLLLAYWKKRLATTWEKSFQKLLTISPSNQTQTSCLDKRLESRGKTEQKV